MSLQLYFAICLNIVAVKIMTAENEMFEALAL